MLDHFAQLLFLSLFHHYKSFEYEPSSIQTAFSFSFVRMMFADSLLPDTPKNKLLSALLLIVNLFPCPSRSNTHFYSALLPNWDWIIFVFAFTVLLWGQRIMFEQRFLITKLSITFYSTHLWLPCPFKGYWIIAIPSLFDASGTSITISENSDLNIQQPGNSFSSSTACICQFDTNKVLSKFFNPTLADDEEANRYWFWSSFEIIQK